MMKRFDTPCDIHICILIILCTPYIINGYGILWACDTVQQKSLANLAKLNFICNCYNLAESIPFPPQRLIRGNFPNFIQPKFTCYTVLFK